MKEELWKTNKQAKAIYSKNNENKEERSSKKWHHFVESKLPTCFGFA